MNTERAVDLQRKSVQSLPSIRKGSLVDPVYIKNHSRIKRVKGQSLQGPGEKKRKKKSRTDGTWIREGVYRDQFPPLGWVLCAQGSTARI